MFRNEETGGVDSFEGEQRGLSREAARISREAAPAAHDPVAGNDDAHRIAAHGTAHGPGRTAGSPLPGDLRSQFSVGDGLPVGNLQQGLPYGPPERSARRVQGRHEIGFPASEIAVEPFDGLHEHGKHPLAVLRAERVAEVSLSFEPEARKVLAVGGDRYAAQRRPVSIGVLHGIRI